MASGVEKWLSCEYAVSQRRQDHSRGKGYNPDFSCEEEHVVNSANPERVGKYRALDTHEVVYRAAYLYPGEFGGRTEEEDVRRSLDITCADCPFYVPRES